MAYARPLNPYCDKELLDAEVDEESPRIIDTVTRAFPYNQGWMLPSSQGNEKPIKGTLSHLLKISTLTKYLTRKTFGIVRSSCELNWQIRVNYALNWPRIWRSRGTRISNATEERVWRRLLHRALNVHNRHPQAANHSCRLGCGCTERMIHLAKCVCTNKAWSRILGIIEEMGMEVPEVQNAQYQDRLLIFGLLPDGHLAHELARGIIRHAWGHVYRHFTRVETDDIVWDPGNVVRDTFKAVIAAVRTRVEAVRLQHVRAMSRAWEEPLTEPTLLLEFDPIAKVYSDGEYCFHKVILDVMQHYGLH